MLSVQPPRSWQVWRLSSIKWPGISSIIPTQWIPNKNSGYFCLRLAFWLVSRHRPGGWCILIPWGKGTAALFGTLPDITLCLFFWLVLICVLRNKTSFRYSTFLSFVNCSIEPEGVIGTPKSAASWTEVLCVAWGLSNLQLSTNVKALLLGMVLSPAESVLTPGGWCQRWAPVMCYVVDSAGLGVPNETRVFLKSPLVHKVLQEVRTIQCEEQV